eukprot:4035023-Prorocentrum_lima.AAC.1
MDRKKYCAFLQSTLLSHEDKEKQLKKQLRDLMFFHAIAAAEGVHEGNPINLALKIIRAFRVPSS